MPDELKEQILNIVMKYANRHKDMWGCDEYVGQNDKAQQDGIDLFDEIITALPEQDEEE